MRKIPLLVVASLAALTGSSPAQAPPGGFCTILTDPPYDAMMSLADPRGTAVNVAHPGGGSQGPVDIRRVDLRGADGVLEVRVTVTELAPSRRGRWHVSFSANGRPVFVEAARGTWLNLGDAPSPDAASGFFAGSAGGRVFEVSGGFDYARGVVAIRAPYAAFGSALATRRRVVSDFSVESSETLAHAGQRSVGHQRQVKTVDSGRSSTRYALGAACS